MKLIAYPISLEPPAIRPAPSGRDWMDATPESYAYRCLPLTIANAHGWEILNPRGFTAGWYGGDPVKNLAVTYDGAAPSPGHVRAMSHFGSGVLTFELPIMFRTEPGWNLMVMGPVNRPKHGIAPLTGVIETDWSPYTFTMNWMFTAPGATVQFAEGEPIAHIFPVQRDCLEKIEPAFADLHSDPDAYEQYSVWQRSRSGFLDSLSAQEAEAVKEKWQKAYYRGLRPDEKPGPRDHKTKLRLKGFGRRA